MNSFHSVWDSLIIEGEDLSFTEWADFLAPEAEARIADLQASTPVGWALEAQEFLDQAYTCLTAADRCPCFCGDCADGRSPFGGCRTLDECALMAAGPVKMSYGYKTVNLAVVRRQLLAGGVRLAGLLDWALDPGAEAPPAFAEMAAEFRRLPNYDVECFASCRGVESVAVPAPERDPACTTR